MAKTPKPELVKLFDDLLWANSPKDWVIHSLYLRQTLFLSILREIPETGANQKIRRSFKLSVINSRSEDLWGLARDCIDEMKTEVKN